MLTDQEEQELRITSKEIDQRRGHIGALKEKFGEEKLNWAILILQERQVVKFVDDKLQIDRGGPHNKEKINLLIDEGYIEQIRPMTARELGLDINQP